MTITTKDGKELQVRELTSADAKALQDFDAGLTSESHRKFFPHKYDDETVTKALARAENGDDYLLGMFDNARLVGYFFLWYMADPVPLLGIGITDEFHRQGLGQQMMVILIDKARETGKDGIDLTTMQDNDAAFALYQKIGFKFYKNVRNKTGDGTIVIERAMFYEITPGAKPMDKPHGPPV